MKRNAFRARICALLALPRPFELRAELSAEGSELLKALTEATDKVKNIAEDALKAAKAGQELSNSIKADADKNLTLQGEIQARMVALEQAVAERLANSGPAGRVDMSLGGQFCRDENFKAFCANPRAFGGANASLSVTLKNVNSVLTNAITTESGSFGTVIEPTIRPGVIPLPQQRLTIRDLLTWGRTVSDAVKYYKESSFTNSAAVVPSELTTKPESSMAVTAETADIVTVAHYMRASRQVLSDVPQLQSLINQRLTYGLKLKEEGQLLKGSGVNGEIEGLMTAASDYADQGIVVDNEQLADRLRLAILQAELAGYSADGIVLSLQDWARLELTKTASDKAYMLSGPFGPTISTLWGRPVVSTASMDQNDYLLGSFGQAAQGWDREDLNITIGLNGNDMIQNAMTILAEERLGLAVYLEAALVKGSFGSL